MTPAEVRAVVEDHRIDLGRVVLTAWHEYKTQYSADTMSKHDPTTRANIVFCHMIDLAQNLAASNQWKTVKDRRFFLVRPADGVAIRFKKLDKKGFTSNVKTQRQEEIRGQQYELSEESLLRVVDVGYTPNDAWTDFVSIRIVYSVAGRLEWDLTLGRELELILDETSLDAFEQPQTHRRVRPAGDNPLGVIRKSGE